MEVDLSLSKDFIAQMLKQTISNQLRNGIITMKQLRKKEKRVRKIALKIAKNIDKTVDKNKLSIDEVLMLMDSLHRTAVFSIFQTFQSHRVITANAIKDNHNIMYG